MHTLPFEQVSPTEARMAFDAALRKPVQAPRPRVSPIANQALPATPLSLVARTWLDALPAQAKATHLAESYPRLTNHIAQLWGKPIETLTYLNELLLDRRCGRQGFQEAVVLELLHLHDLCMASLPPRNPFLPNDPWLLGNDPQERNAAFHGKRN
ncbi:hypothetical protein OPU71_01410 [Niveibacterium sp. 24ML]|uniref:hypothetical protein n=1 Tax=Niveibacterium sp. 24ML TaxID=2985512 RepID=UPI0022713EBC|nr:hypothetical protein [Niveibacterium sp. 24ML]MCX9154776.1 hypothetical protein [Niveibacterium sp. 24ML]